MFWLLLAGRPPDTLLSLDTAAHDLFAEVPGSTLRIMT